ncbi:MAG: hypothetical protein IKA47_09300, partial [Oscillospiraceae bacterium]|nr:hypothetical protein [Oscillospiraceae bacterium]
AFNEHNRQLPLWTNEGVRFVSVSFQQALDFQDKNGAANENVGFYRFYFKELAADTILDEFLANGTTDTGITIRIKVSYVTASGMAATQHFAFTSELVKQYVTGERGWDNSAFEIYLTGVAGLESLTFAAEIVSEAKDGSTVVIGSSSIAD